MNNKKTTYGDVLHPLLQGINDALWEREAAFPKVPHDFPEESLLAATKIFTAVLWDFLYKKQQDSGMCMDDSLDEVKEAGQTIRQIVTKYTGKDPHQLMKKYLDEETK